MNKRTERFINSLDPVETDRLLLDLMKKRPPNELLGAQNQRTSLASVGEYVDEAAERVKLWGKLQGLQSGYYSVDAMTKGLVPGELIILSGIESHGKTQLALNIAYQVACAGTPVLFATLEMTKPEITSRIMKLGGEKIAELPILFQKEAGLDYRDVSPLIKNAKSEGVELVIVDHLHMMIRGADNTASEIGKIVQEFKKAAIKNDVPIILLCQLRRINDKENGKRREPEMQDLKESSYISQDADIVLILHRNLEDQEADNDKVTLVIHKNRNRGIFRDTRRAQFTAEEGVRLIETADITSILGFS